MTSLYHVPTAEAGKVGRGMESPNHHIESGEGMLLAEGRMGIGMGNNRYPVQYTICIQQLLYTRHYVMPFSGII